MLHAIVDGFTSEDERLDRVCLDDWLAEPTLAPALKAEDLLVREMAAGGDLVIYRRALVVRTLDAGMFSQLNENERPLVESGKPPATPKPSWPGSSSPWRRVGTQAWRRGPGRQERR